MIRVLLVAVVMFGCSPTKEESRKYNERAINGELERVCIDQHLYAYVPRGNGSLLAPLFDENDKPRRCSGKR